MKLWKRTIKLILCTIISLLYINSLAFAEETTNNNRENTTFIEGKGEYASIQKAIDAIDKEGTIYVLKSHTISKQIVIPTNKNITIKPIGKIEIVRSTNVGKIPLFRVEEKSSLTLGEENVTDTQLIVSTESEKKHDNHYITKLMELGGTLTLNNDVLLDLSHDSYQTGITIKKNGSLIMNGNAKIETNSASVTCIEMLENAVFEMNDSSILKGGIYVSQNSHFTVNNGSILGCRGDYFPDSLITVKDKSLFTMNGGSITENYVQDIEDEIDWLKKVRGDSSYRYYGGAIFMGTYDESQSVFIMTGGEISDNSANTENGLAEGGDGGAISARGAKISLLGGTIGNNSADIGNILLEDNTEMEVSTQMQVTGDIYIDKESSIKITKDEEESVQFQLPEGYEKELGGLQLNLQSENKEDWISFTP